MKSPPIAFTLALGVLLSLAAPQALAGVVEKTWFFTTTDSLTVDVRFAPGFEPDWSQSTVSLTRIGTNEPAVRRKLEARFARVDAVNKVVRLNLGELKVAPWSPASPALYNATLEIADRSGRRETVAQRVGFRLFSTKGGQLYLNGRPTFLRGLAINPPGRGIPEKVERSRAFAEDYVRFMRGLNVNIIRIPDDETWYSVCDELGMMVFGGNYAGSVNGANASGDPATAARWYRETKFHPISQHPALMIYALTNEVAGEGAAGARWDAFLGSIHHDLQPWDPTRLYIANAGYGYGRVGEINDLHRYWGWYYESPFTFLHLRDYDRIVAPDKIQPLTFTECVGNYNGPDGRTNLTPNHKNPLAQLNWMGHAPSWEQGQLGFEHQAFTIRQATELFRRLRPANPELSGVFPFTILFNQWHTISQFTDMGPKPAATQLRTSYQPVLLSWELYTTQVYAGSVLKPIAHVVNDANDGADLHGATLHYDVRDSTERVVAQGQLTGLDVPYYGTARRPLAITLPETLATGLYHLSGRLTSGNDVISENQSDLFIAARDYARTGVSVSGSVRLFDPVGVTSRAFTQSGIEFTSLSVTASVEGKRPVVIGEDASAKLDPSQTRALLEFARHGGRVLILRQNHANAAAVAALLPVAVRMPAASIDDPAYPPPPRPSCDSFNINPERPDHPVFAGIDRRQLHVWSDYTGWDEQQKGMPHIYPVTDGFVLTHKHDIQNVAVLANYSQGLEGIALAEFFVGDGSVLLSGFDLAARAGLDPIADRFFRNLVSYVSRDENHERYVLIDAPIEWGNYETERGILTGINSGLMLNSRPSLTGSYRDVPITVTKEGHEFAGGAGGWNNRPGIVYVPFGRRPFGPYVHRGWSGTPEIEDEKTTEGVGQFWCRIPAGKKQAVHRVCNPSEEKLTVHVAANARDVAVEIGPGATASVVIPLAPETSVVETTIRGDRRLVLLETAFD